jgi:hypothetical protein
LKTLLQKGWIFLALLWPMAARAVPGFDTSSPVNYFSSVANKFLAATPAFAGAGLSLTNIPVYPTNCYTPAVHRLLQLAANIYDASTNKTSAPPLDFDYPSVFRPVFGISTNDGAMNIFIDGYVEVTTNADYNLPVYSLTDPSGLLNIESNLLSGSNNFNIYEIPWVIGAKKGLPNFNQISLESFSALSRKLQIVKPSLGANRSMWHTNVQYVLAFSNVIEVEAWNSYVSNYPRAVDITGSDSINTTFTNEFGTIASISGSISNLIARSLTPSPPFQTTPLFEASNSWAGVGANLTSNLAASFRFPMLTTNILLPSDIYSTTSPYPPTGTFINVPNALTAGFQTTTGYPLPLFGLTFSNRLRFVMVDDASGRVIDYVQLSGMTGQRSLTSAGELEGNDDWGPGGVWDTNRIPFGSGGINNTIYGIENQIAASMQPPPYVSAGYTTPVTANAWNFAVVQTMGFNSIVTAAEAFNAFFNNNTNVSTPLSMQVPFTPTRTVCVYYTWQANDPLVHYTLPDLTDLIDYSNNVQTNWTSTNLILGYLGQLNRRYNPWGGALFPVNGDYNYNLTLMDPLATSSDQWNFPAGSLSFASIGSVHRGTPWQTVYLKSAPVDPMLWQKWTGNLSPTDAAASQPVNDWHLVALLAPLLNPVDPRQLASANQPDYTPLLDGMTVVTNADPPAYLVMTSNSPQAAIIAASISALRATQPGGIFTNLGDVLGAPGLSVASPWLNIDDPTNPVSVSDADYELVPSQLLALLRNDSIGSAAMSNGVPQILFTGTDGYAYEVEASTNFQNWCPLAEEFTTNGVFSFTDPAAAGFPRRYYRTSLLPGP